MIDPPAEPSKILAFDSTKKREAEPVDLDTPFFVIARTDYSKCTHRDRGVTLDTATRKAICLCGVEIDCFDALLIYAQAQTRLVRHAKAIEEHRSRCGGCETSDTSRGDVMAADVILESLKEHLAILLKHQASPEVIAAVSSAILEQELRCTCGPPEAANDPHEASCPQYTDITLVYWKQRAEAAEATAEQLRQEKYNLIQNYTDHLSRMQQHRDTWREYAYGRREKPSDFLDGDKLDRGLTKLELADADLTALRAGIARLAQEWRERASNERADRWCNTQDVHIWMAIHEQRGEVFDRCADQLAALALPREGKP